MKFTELSLSPQIVQAISDCGYVEPTPIQAQAIPHVLEGKDIIASAQTGTGKTAAFTLPMLQRLSCHRRPGPRALILQPTRELALQVDQNLKVYTQYLDIKRALIYGGVGFGAQIDQIEAGADIVCATPGRLIDLLERGNISTEHIEMLVLDEVDRMLDMGFIDQVRTIVNQCPKNRQTLLFSATIPEAISRLAAWALKDPVVIDIGGNRRPAETIEHAVYPINGLQRYDLVVAMLNHFNFESIIIFTRMKIEADRIAKWIEDHGHKVVVLHADRSQKERTEAVEGFKSGKYEILVATDIASRGLDITGVTHVINFNVPQHAEDYVHRIGRTGRAQKTGEAYTLFSSDETPYLEAIERYIGKTIPRRKLEGFRYRIQPDIESASKPASRRRNR